MDLYYPILHQCSIVLATDVHCYHRLGTRLVHLDSPLHRAEKPAPHVIAVFLDLDALALTLVLLAYKFSLIPYSCLITSAYMDLECRSQSLSLVTTTTGKQKCTLRI